MVKTDEILKRVFLPLVPQNVALEGKAEEKSEFHRNIFRFTEAGKVVNKDVKMKDLNLPYNCVKSFFLLLLITRPKPLK